MILGAVSWETVGVFGGFVIAALVMLGGIAVRAIKFSQKDATREVVKDEVMPVLNRMDRRVTVLEEDNVEIKLFRARLEGMEEGRKQAKEGT